MVSAELFPLVFTVIMAKPKIRLNPTIATMGSFIPKSTPKAIPVRAEWPMASEKKDILLDTTKLPKVPKRGAATSTANRAFFIKFGSSQLKGRMVSMKAYQKLIDNKLLVHQKYYGRLACCTLPAAIPLPQWSCLESPLCLHGEPPSPDHGKSAGW